MVSPGLPRPWQPRGARPTSQREILTRVLFTLEAESRPRTSPLPQLGPLMEALNDVALLFALEPTVRSRKRS